MYLLYFTIKLSKTSNKNNIVNNLAEVINFENVVTYSATYLSFKCIFINKLLYL